MRGEHMLRETGFAIGGVLLVAVGIGLGAALGIAGIGWDGFYLYTYSTVGVGLGGFFVYVGRAERRARLGLLGRERSWVPP